MKEVFMDIKGYEGIYQISNLGRIKNSKNKIMKQYKNNAGYMMICLCKNCERKAYLVHRLVLSTFKPTSNSELQVNHLDENKTNNNLNNLSWCTCKENINYGTHNERVANSSKIKVTCIELNKTFDSATDASIFLTNKKNGRGNITKCCKGKRKSYAGYTWKYAEEE